MSWLALLRRWGLWGIVVVVLSGCAYTSQISMAPLLVFLGLLAAACGGRAAPASNGESAVHSSCGEGNCPVGMTCVEKDLQPWCVPDADQDGVPDDQDNCEFASNPDQADSGGLPGLGDSCDLCTDTGPWAVSPCCNPCVDSDGDSVPDLASFTPLLRDNCPFVPNKDQSDRDNDGLGDVCDLMPDSPQMLSPCMDAGLDTDGDGLADSCPAVDSCLTTPSDHIGDADNDGLGDVCDPDGIPPIAMVNHRRTLLHHLGQSGVLDEATVQIALTALS